MFSFFGGDILYKNLTYQLSQNVDQELYHFYMHQTDYHHLLGCIVDFQYVKDDREIPQGFAQENHFCYKIYDDQMIGYIDILKGYRYSMIHDDNYLWIGLLMVDQELHRQNYGHTIMSDLKKEWGKKGRVIQLGCLAHNEKGLSFWKSEGFKEIDRCHNNPYDVVVLEYQF